MVKNKEEKETAESGGDKALELAVSALEKEFGVGTIITGSSSFPLIDRIPSGSIQLDVALNGGYPRGRMVEIMGPESSGKTTLALHAIAEAQKQKLTCAFIDTEHSLDIEYAAALGIKKEELLVAQPDCGEQALEIVEKLTRSGSLGLIVVDSVAALTPRAELEGEMGASHMGLHARLMSQAMRKLTAIIYTTKTLVIFTNQIRMKIGVMFGSPETTTGGNALKFYASQRLDIRRVATLAESTVKDAAKTGSRTQVKVIKNKVGAPFKMVQFNIMYGKGIDGPLDLLELAVERELVEKSGAWYIYKGEKVQGTTNMANYLRERPEEMNELRKIILE